MDRKGIKENIFHHEKLPLSGEIFQILLKEKNVVIEKILSSEHVPEKEYNQDHDEWVILLEGKAEILMNNRISELTPGDYVFIKAGIPHRVLKTSQGAVWLAVHIY